MAVQALTPEDEMVLDELQALVVDQQKVVSDPPVLTIGRLMETFSTVLTRVCCPVLPTNFYVRLSSCASNVVECTFLFVSGHGQGASMDHFPARPQSQEVRKWEI